MKFLKKLHAFTSKPNLLESLELLLEETDKRQITVQTLLALFSGHGLPLLLIILSLPFCQPIQIPGFSTPFGLLIAFIGFRIAFGTSIWLPQSILQKNIKQKTLKSILKKSIWLIKKIKRFTKSRLLWIAQNPIMHKFNGILIAILGIVLALPLPIPASNLIAAWSILFISLGLAEDDGLMISIGYGIAALCVLFFCGIYLFVEYIYKA